MSIPDEVIDKIETEIKKEVAQIKGISDGPPQKLADIEKRVLEIRNIFGQRLMEEAVKYQGTGELLQKKTVQNAALLSKIKD